MNIEEIFKEDGVIKRKNKNYKTRPSQIKGAKLLDKAIQEKKHFILEGPCGFGKSIAYLIPTLKYLIENNYKDKIVIVTSNISLQEQLIEKDIPFVLDVLSEVYPKKNVKKALEPCVLKGIGNFLCMDKIEDEDFFSKETFINKTQFEKVYSFYNNTRDGDLSKLDIILSNDMKKIATITSDDCKSTGCNYYNKCFYKKHKVRANDSKIIVTNYHMLFSTINSFSSAFEDATLFVFDECHEAESILRKNNTYYISNSKIEYIEKKIKEIKNKLNGTCNAIDKIEIEKLKEYAQEYFNNLEYEYNKYDDKYKVIKSINDLPQCDNFVFILEKTIGDLKSLIEQVGKLIHDIKKSNNLEEDSIENELYKKYRYLIIIIESLIRTCTKIKNYISNQNDLLSDENNVLWLEKDNNSIALGCTNIDVSDNFKNNFLVKKNNIEKICIFSSATLSVGGNFEFFKNNLGLNKIGEDKIEEYIAQSPFNLKNQELWYLPENLLPVKHEDFDNNLPNQIESIIKATNGGVLCLFTSIKNMNYCKEELRKRNITNTILVQDESSKSKLIDLFSNDDNSILLATKSFFTGVDIPGQTLRCIIIDKLPFTTPNDPVSQKLNERDGSFYNYSLPQMIITLKQAVGRGVRTIDDKCVICILDSRIETASYRENIFSSFNYVSRISKNINNINDFFSDKKEITANKDKNSGISKSAYCFNSNNNIKPHKNKMKICQCEKGFTNIYVLLNIKTKEKYIGTNQLKREEDILEKLFKLAHNEKRDTYNSELYKHLRLYSKNDFIIKVIKRDIEIGFITDEYKLDLLMSTFKNFKVEDLLSNKQKERLKEVATIQSIVDRIVNFKY